MTSTPPPSPTQEPTLLEGRLPRGALTLGDRTPPEPGRAAADRGARYLLRDVVADDVRFLLDDVEVAVDGGVYSRCTFEQRMDRFATGAFGGPDARTAYQDCTFLGVRLGADGFSAGRARFEGCTFRDCRVEGFSGWRADFLGCRFIGRLDGMLLAGVDPDSGLPNEIWGNDFRAARLSGVALRAVDADDQRWPAGTTLEVTAGDEIVVRTPS